MDILVLTIWVPPKYWNSGYLKVKNEFHSWRRINYLPSINQGFSNPQSKIEETLQISTQIATMSSTRIHGIFWGAPSITSHYLFGRNSQPAVLVAVKLAQPNITIKLHPTMTCCPGSETPKDGFIIAIVTQNNFWWNIPSKIHGYEATNLTDTQLKRKIICHPPPIFWVQNLTPLNFNSEFTPEKL